MQIFGQKNAKKKKIAKKKVVRQVTTFVAQRAKKKVVSRQPNLFI